jgi:hypothetical protein
MRFTNTPSLALQTCLRDTLAIGFEMKFLMPGQRSNLRLCHSNGFSMLCTFWETKHWQKLTDDSRLPGCQRSRWRLKAYIVHCTYSTMLTTAVYWQCWSIIKRLHSPHHTDVSFCCHMQQWNQANCFSSILLCSVMRSWIDSSAVLLLSYKRTARELKLELDWYAVSSTPSYDLVLLSLKLANVWFACWQLFSIQAPIYVSLSSSCYLRSKALVSISAATHYMHWHCVSGFCSCLEGIPEIKMKQLIKVHTCAQPAEDAHKQHHFLGSCEHDACCKAPSGSTLLLPKEA